MNGIPYSFPPGTRVGPRTVIREVNAHAFASGPKRRFLCQCDCGSVPHEVYGADLRRYPTRSCGCGAITFRRSRVGEKNGNWRHGQVHRVEYHAWAAAKARCTNPKLGAWKNYGGRGITMAPAWVHDFAAFLAHVGPRPAGKYSLDRIDNAGHYVPGNVRWTTWHVQRMNQRNLHLRGRRNRLRQAVI